MSADRSGRFVDGWRMSVGTLTAVPVRPPSRIDRDVAARAMLLAPLATAPVAAVWLSGGILSALVPLPLLWAVLSVTGMVLATRAMHLDGLADTADGLSASYDRDRALEVMKTGDVGPSGAAAIALTLMVQIAATAAVYIVPSGWALALGTLAVVTSRLSLAVACRRGVPAARPGGLGATVAGSVSPGALGTSAVVLGCVGTLVLGLAQPVAGLGSSLQRSMVPSVLDVAAVLAVLLAMTVATSALVRRCTRRLGGVTGDVLGAAIEVSCAATLLVAAVFCAAAV